MARYCAAHRVAADADVAIAMAPVSVTRMTAPGVHLPRAIPDADAPRPAHALAAMKTLGRSAFEPIAMRANTTMHSMRSIAPAWLNRHETQRVTTRTNAAPGREGGVAAVAEKEAMLPGAQHRSAGLQRKAAVDLSQNGVRADRLTTKGQLKIRLTMRR